jgi:hypothetical protein
VGKEKDAMGKLVGVGRAVLSVLLLVGASVGCGKTTDTSAAPTSGASSTAATSTNAWDGLSPFMCGGSQSFTLKDMNVELKTGPAIRAGGNCQLTLQNCTIKAPVALAGGGNAKITVQGGRIEGTEKALDIGGSISISVTGGAVVVGPFHIAGSARVDGIPDSDPRLAKWLARAAGKPAQDAAAVLCANPTDCYDQAGEFGQIGGRLALQMAADGTVTRVTYSGTASKKVQQCLVDATKARRAPGYTLGAGELDCDYSGTFTHGTSMMTSGAEFKKAGP